MALMWRKTIGIPASRYAIRTYMARPVLSNPYTGILAFLHLARLNRRIEIFEDAGKRDFVYIADAVEATWRALAASGRKAEALNIGSEPQRLFEVAKALGAIWQRIESVVTGCFRQENPTQPRRTTDAAGVELAVTHGSNRSEHLPRLGVGTADPACCYEHPSLKWLSGGCSARPYHQTVT